MSSERNKVLITTTGLSSVGQGGGISSYVHNLAAGLSAYGFNVHVFLVCENPGKQLSSVNYNFKSFEVPENFSHEEAVARLLLREVSILNPDVLINNDVSYIAGFWSVLPLQMVKISVVHGYCRGATLTNCGIQGKIACYNHKWVDWIVCQNDYMRQSIKEEYGILKNKLLTIYQTSGKINCPHKIKSTSDLRILCACGANIKKGALTMFRLAKSLLQTKIRFSLTWCLDVPNNWKENLKDNRIIFRGNLRKKDFEVELNKSDLIIIPTEMDTGPLILVEAMAHGTIPICNNLRESAIPDIIENGVNGYTVDNNNVNSYLRIITSLAEDKETRMKIRNSALNTYALRLDNNVFLQQYVAILRQKQTDEKPVYFSLKNILCFHLHKTSHLPKLSIKRVFVKFLTVFRIIVNYHLYKTLFSKFIH